MIFNKSLVVCMSVWLVSGERPLLSTLKPLNFPNLSDVTEDPIGNRTEGLPVEDRSNIGVDSRVQYWPIEYQPFWFGDSTERLPVEAKGDRDLVNRLSKLPIDQQPFWYINWKAIEENNKNPQTYPQRPNSFTDANVSGGSNPGGAITPNSGIPNNQPNSADLTSKFGNSNPVNSNSNSYSGSQQNRQNRQLYKYFK